MSLADRDYMKSSFDQEEKRKQQPSLYKRLLFFLWRLIRAVFKKQ